MQRISSFFRSSQQTKEEEPTLPARFAEEVLDLELEVESNPKVEIELVNRLIELYSIAVEYYEAIKSNKYVVFKNKITKLLLNPSINRAMESTTKESMIFGEEEPNRPTNELRKKELEHTLTYATQNTEGEVRTILMSANDRFENVSKMISSGIVVQEYEIRERLKRRKKNKNEPVSRDSTESDSKELQDQTQMQPTKPFEQIPEAPCQESLDLQTQPNSVEIPQQVIPQQSVPITQQLLTPQELFMVKLEKIERKKKRKLLTLKADQKAELPEQYNIPF